MDANFRIRTVKAGDAPELQRTCWPNASLEGISELLYRAEGLARRNPGIGLIAYNDSAILGYGQLTLWPRVAEISDLIVTPPSRGLGIGSSIISHLIDKVRAWRMSEVEIGVALSNPRARALYERL